MIAPKLKLKELEILRVSLALSTAHEGQKVNYTMRTNNTDKQNYQPKPLTTAQKLQSIVSDVASGIDTRYGLAMVGGWTRDIIDLAIKEGLIVDTLGLITLPLSSPNLLKPLNTEAEMLAEGRRLVASDDPAMRQHGYCILGGLEGHDSWLTSDLPAEQEESTSLPPVSETRRLARQCAIERVYDLAGQIGLSTLDLAEYLSTNYEALKPEELDSDDIGRLVKDLKSFYSDMQRQADRVAA